jgi:hypothetical protein
MTTGVELVRRQRRLADQLRGVFGEMRALEILFATMNLDSRRPPEPA